MKDTNADTLQRFIFENADVRGELVHLRASYQTAQGEIAYPAVVAEQLGQTLAASVLLSATIKFDGALIIQVQSSGPITLMVAQCTHQRHIRGLAHWQETEVEGDTVESIYGVGTVAITINTQKQQERYQGIVALEGEKLANALENYFYQSEQLPTRLFLFANQSDAVGLLLQKLPGGAEDDFWNRINLFAETLTSAEMLSLSNQDILHRLFHEEDIRIFDEEPVSFRCTCSTERIEAMLLSMGPTEVQSIIAELGQVRVGCEFCNHQYVFDKVDVEQIFSADFNPPAPDVIQ